MNKYDKKRRERAHVSRNVRTRSQNGEKRRVLPSRFCCNSLVSPYSGKGGLVFARSSSVINVNETKQVKKKRRTTRFLRRIVYATRARPPRRASSIL